LRIARAMATRCFWPPLSWIPPSPTLQLSNDTMLRAKAQFCRDRDAVHHALLLQPCTALCLSHGNETLSERN